MKRAQVPPMGFGYGYGGSRIFISIIVTVILILGYAYIKAGDIGVGIQEFISWIMQDPIAAGCIFLMGIILGYYFYYRSYQMMMAMGMPMGGGYGSFMLIFIVIIPIAYAYIKAGDIGRGLSSFISFLTLDPVAVLVLFIAGFLFGNYTFRLQQYW